MLMDKLIKISSTSKGEKLPVESFEDKISFLKKKKKSPTGKKGTLKIRSRCHHYEVINIKE